jgi:hypothetical protein
MVSLPSLRCIYAFSLFSESNRYQHPTSMATGRRSSRESILGHCGGSTAESGQEYTDIKSVSLLSARIYTLGSQYLSRW